MVRTITDIIESNHHTADVRLVRAKEIELALKEAGRTNSMLLVGGGDGTVSTAAALFTGEKIALGILPLGTMNLFARALGIPLKLGQAVEAVIAGTKQKIDVGEVNGRIFVHHVTLGL